MSDTLGPIEVEFTIPDSFGKEADTAIKSMGRLTDAATKMPADVKAAMLEQRGVIKMIDGDIKQLEKSLKSVAPGTAKQEILLELAAAKRALEEEKAGLLQLEQASGKAADGNRRLTYVLRDLQDQMTKMRLAGKQNTAEYKEMELAAAKLSDEIRDVKNVTKNLADDQATFTGFAQGITGLTGAFSAAGGAVALFAGENENLQKIQTKVQGLMAITIGLQQVSNTLNKDSAFMTVTVARARNLWAVAEGKLTVALWGSTAAARALMVTVTLGLAVAIPALIALYDRLVSKQKAAAEAQKEAMRITTESNIEAGKARIEIDQTIKKLQNFKGSKDAEKRMLGEVNKAYGDTFGTYKTLAEWLDVLKTKAADYVRVMFLQSKATRLVDKAVKFDTAAQQISAQPLTDFVDMNDVQQATNVFGKVDEVKLKQMAEERKRLQVDNANSRRDLALKESELIQTQLQELQNNAGINVNYDDDKNKDKTAQTYAEKLAEVKKFFELYKTAIELGQKEAAAIFLKQLPAASTYEEYITQELAKANNAGDFEKAAVLIPEKNEVSKGFKELLNEYKTYSEQKAEIEKSYNAQIAELTRAGYGEKAKIAAEARDKELKDLDDAQPLNALVDKYKDYRKQILEITEKSNKEIADLRAAGYDEEAAEAARQRDIEIQNIIIESELQAYERINEMGRKELKKFMAKVKAKIDLMKAEGKAVGELEKVYADAESHLNGPDSGSIKSFRTVAMLMGNISGAASNINEELGQMANLAANLAGGLGDALEGLKKGGQQGIAAFGSMVSIVADVADQLDKAFGRQKRIADIEQQRELYNNRLRLIIDETNVALDRQLRALERIQSIEKNEAYAETFEFIRESIEKTKKLLDEMEFDFLPAPDDLGQTIDLTTLMAMTQAADEAEAIRRALATGLISQEQADIALEYLSTLEGLTDQVGELSAQQIEWLTQTSGVELADQLADSITNAFNAGESAAIAWGDVTDEVISNAIKNALKLKLLSGPMNEAVEELAKNMEGGLSPEEQEEFRRKMEEAGQNFTNALNLYPDLFGPESDNSTVDPGERNSFTRMTEQTGNELLGQFTALRMTSARISDILSDERQARTSMRATLEAIADNTSYCRKLEDIDRTLKSLDTDGIKLR